MGRNGPFGTLRGFDAFGKVSHHQLIRRIHSTLDAHPSFSLYLSQTIDDVRIRTNIGAYITLISLSLILTLTTFEFLDYRRLHLKQSLEVDRSRGERLTVNLNVTFPRVPCYLISLDVMDISGEHQNDLTHDIQRVRLEPNGKPVEGGSKKGLKGEADRLAGLHDKDFCGSCYGGSPPASGCCNTCEDVREAYVKRGWSFDDPDHIDQVSEAVKQDEEMRFEIQRRKNAQFN